ncbi:hypothetical protein [uncultured Bacteroides sp.]|uniref:hypothetical protein n=1 Tax=uncultured Bacteroides sp. TaxID=162156 RepID=UPI0025E3E472|nr:hypothetical protein [uncultured Bacteroides sp.]
MKKQISGTLNVPASGIPAMGESVNALTNQVSNLKKLSAKVCGFKKNHHLCSALHFDKARMFASFIVGIFYVQWLSYSSDPRVESLMASLPYQGVVQRESGTFFVYKFPDFLEKVPFPFYNQYIVSF